MSTKRVRVAVTGAAGQIGYALLFRIASGAMFGPNTCIDLNLIELPAAMQALKGVKMEIEDCAFSLLTSITITSDLAEGFKDADWALLVGAVPRKAGMERKELLSLNGKIFIDQGLAISKNAKTTCKTLVIGNPCNTNAYIAKSVSKNMPQENFFAMTMLDQNRACAQLAQKAKVSIEAVNNIAIWGNHSLTQYPDFYNAKIDSKPVTDIISDEQWLQTDFLEKVQKRGAEIIAVRGLSSAASAANAVIDTVKNLSTPTPDGEFFSVAVSSDGSYGVPEGIMFSYPVRSDGQNWEIVQGITHNEFGKQKIATTIDELLQEEKMVTTLLKNT